jgi:tRNA(Phe) wybutosine-synthesizing methylase Tyw3
MTAILSKELWIAIGAVALAAYLVHWGDSNGFNASKVRAIQRELDRVNAEVSAYNRTDDQAAVNADALRAEGYQKALAELGTSDKCVVTPAMVRAFERIAR